MCVFSLQLFSETLPWKSNKYFIFWVCVFSLRHLACSAVGHIAGCGLFGSTIFVPPYRIKGTIEVLTTNAFFFLFNCCLKYFLFQGEFSKLLPQMHVGLCVTYPLFWSDCYETWIFLADFQKYSSVKFIENPSDWRSVVPCGRTDVTNLIVAFRGFANATKMYLDYLSAWQTGLKLMHIFVPHMLAHR